MTLRQSLGILQGFHATLMNQISFSENRGAQKNAHELARVLSSSRQEDPEFKGIPKPTEQEAADDIQKRIEELRSFIQSQ